MSNYICIAKSYFETTLDKGCETFQNELKIIQNLKSIRTFVNLTEDEIKLLENARDLLMEKLEKLEDLIEDENNVFYDFENDE